MQDGLRRAQEGCVHPRIVYSGKKGKANDEHARGAGVRSSNVGTNNNSKVGGRGGRSPPTVSAPSPGTKIIRGMSLTINTIVKGMKSYLSRVTAAVHTVAARKQRRVAAKEWLWDTGAALDIVPRSALKGAEHLIQTSSTAIQLSTAGGPCEAAEEIVLETDMLEEKAFKPAVLDATPAALSAGWRCMELGYEFHWKPYQPPILIYPSGKQITLRVDSYVPILDAEVYTAAQYADTTQMFALPARMVPERKPLAPVAVGGEGDGPPLEDGVRAEDDEVDEPPLGVGGDEPAMDPPVGPGVADGVGGATGAMEPDDYHEPDLEGDPVSLRDQA